MDNKTYRAYEVGLSGKSLVKMSACPGCGLKRWKRLECTNELCIKCSAKKRTRETRPVTYFGIGDPKVGDISQAKTLGYSGDYLLYYNPCAKCGTPRWVRRKSLNTHCPHCAVKYTGVRKDRNTLRYMDKGYVRVYIEKDDPLRPMTFKGWVFEHRLVMARIIGRVLTRKDVVHHINGIRSDNREENLQLMNEHTHHSHLTAQELQRQIKVCQRRITLLEAEVLLLRSGGMPIPSEASFSNEERVETRREASRRDEGIVQSSRKLDGNAESHLS